MQVTAFAFVFLPLALGVAVLGRAWLPALLLFCTALQAVSVLNVPVGAAVHGISPYNVVGAIVACVLALRLFRRGQWRRLPALLADAAPRLLAGYVLLAVAGAFVLPHLFAGTPVYLLINRFGFDQDLSPLVFTLSNVAQAVNLGVHAVVLLFLLHAAQRPDWQPQRLLWGVGAAVALILAVGLHERLALAGAWPGYAHFWMNNPGYEQLSEQAIAGIRRVVAPFSEASYASAYLAAVWAGLLALLAMGRRPVLALPALALVGLGLLNTLGATGWAAAAIVTPLVVLLLTARGMVEDDWGRALRARVARAWSGLLLAAAAGAWLWAASPVAPRVQQVVYETVLVRAKPETTNRARVQANERVGRILVDTYGLGAGLGSHRASSYAASLAGNTGIPGLLLFAGMLGALLWPYLRAPRLGDAQIFAAAALVGATVAVSLSIPDLNVPLYWGFVFLAFLHRPPTTSFAGRQAG